MSKYFTIDLAIKKLQLLVGAPGEGSQHVWTQKRIIYRDNDDSQHLLKASLDRPPPRQSAKHFTCIPSFNPYATVCNAG